MEIPGKDAALKADALAQLLREICAEEPQVKVTCPVWRISGFDVIIPRSMIVEKIAEFSEEVRPDDVRVGTLRNNGYIGTV